MTRGEVWWADLPAPSGTRPVLLVSRDSAYKARHQAMVAPITSRTRDIPAEVPLGPEDGLERACVANLDTLATVPLSALRDRIATLSAERLQAVDAARRYALGLSPA